MVNAWEQPSEQPADQPELHGIPNPFEFEEQLSDRSSGRAGQSGLLALLLSEQQRNSRCVRLAFVQYDAHSAAEHRR